MKAIIATRISNRFFLRSFSVFGIPEKGDEYWKFLSPPPVPYKDVHMTEGRRKSLQGPFAFLYLHSQNAEELYHRKQG
jgi:hypothetical protein